MAKNYIQYAKGIKDGSVLGKLKDHLKEYWITSPTDCVEFKLDIIGEETLTAENDVTDHFVESNISYQDQVAIKPKIYTIQGEVGELVWYQKDSASQIYGQVAQRLEGVISFLPVRSRGFNQMKDKVMKAAQWVDTADNLISKFSNIKSEITYMLGADGNESEKERTLSKQEAAYLTLLGYRDDRLRPLNIKTPWGVLENYIMTSLKITQPKETRDKSYISMTFKELRLSSVSTVRFDQTKYQGAAGLENQPLVDKGSTSGTEVDIGTYNYQMADGNVVEACDIPQDIHGYADTDIVAIYDEKSGFSVLDKETDKALGTESFGYREAVDYAVNKCKLGIGKLK